MRSTYIVLLFVAAGFGLWVGGTASSEEEVPAEGGAPACTPEEQAAMMEAATPGDNHTWLGQFAGTWDVAMESTLRSGEVENNKATATFRMLLGGRYQEQRFQGTFGGEPYEGHGITGFDNTTKVFQNYWFDTMGTTGSVSQGQRAADGKSITFNGKWDTPGGSVPFRQVLTQTDANSFTFTMYGSFSEEETQIMHAVYTKRQ